MDRQKLQRLAKARLLDAKALLGRKRWSGAYYLCGYAIECALKACLLRHLGESGAVFGDPQYLKSLAGCWTHDLAKLVNLAGLDAEFGVARGANATLKSFWGVVEEWQETSRYDEMTEVEAKALFEAVTNNPHGILTWLQPHW